MNTKSTNPTDISTEQNQWKEKKNTSELQKIVTAV
jgi:hypothetical protein